MKFKYLGTAAYEGVPALYCSCRVCQESFRLGKRNIRTRSQALLNEEILIDFNPDTLIHYQTYRFDFKKIKACIVTHNHSDHYYYQDVVQHQYALKTSSVPPFYLPRKSIEETRAYCLDRNVPLSILNMHELKAREVIKLDGYEILPLRAKHNPYSDPYIFAIKKDDKAIIYWHDSGKLDDIDFKALKAFAKYDLVSLDSTCFYQFLDKVIYDNHMNIHGINAIYNMLKENDMLKENAKIILNHFSHNAQLTYEEMLKYVKDNNLPYEVSYDGMEIDL